MNYILGIFMGVALTVGLAIVFLLGATKGKEMAERRNCEEVHNENH